MTAARIPSPRVAAACERLPRGMMPRRAWPGAGGELAVEAELAGLPGLAGVLIAPDRVRVRHGTDPRLPALAAELAGPGVRLLGHRPGRRAVLRAAGRGDSAGYVKIVRPGRAGPVAAALLAASRLLGDAATVPEVREVDDGAGVVRLAAVPGPTLHALLGAGSPRAAAVAAAVDAALAALAAAPADGLPHHDHTAEAAVVHRWVAHAAAWDGPDLAGTAEAVTVALHALPGREPVAAHRDLHDKQVVDTRGGVGLLDLDTLCRADPALDRGNLLAHLALRVLQRRCPPELADRCAARLRPGADGVAVDVYTAAALVRLAGVYTFRPGPADLPEALHAAARAVLNRVG